jgi:hypothetical protein
MKKTDIYISGLATFAQIRIYMTLGIPFTFAVLTFIAIFVPNFMNISQDIAIIGFILSIIFSIVILIMIRYQLKTYKNIKEERRKLDLERKRY